MERFARCRGRSSVLVLFSKRLPRAPASAEEHRDDDRGKPAVVGGDDPSASPKLERCEDCGRTFAEGRLQTHAKVGGPMLAGRHRASGGQSMLADWLIEGFPATLREVRWVSRSGCLGGEERLAVQCSWMCLWGG